jgi:hypothetical protein
MGLFRLPVCLSRLSAGIKYLEIGWSDFHEIIIQVIPLVASPKSFLISYNR